MDNAKKLILLNEYFTELREILIRENEDNWLKGINAILSTLHFAIEDNNDAKETIISVGSTFSFMNSGNDSFSDFYIQREDLDERARCNEAFMKIKNNIVGLLAGCRAG